MGFEPTRAEPNGLAVHRLNHSATSSPTDADTSDLVIASFHVCHKGYAIISQFVILRSQALRRGRMFPLLLIRTFQDISNSKINSYGNR